MSALKAIHDKVPTDPRARSLWVQHRLRLNGSSFSAIAKKLGCKPRTVSQAMYMPSFRQEQAIAEELDLPIEDLFPERYPDGGRIHRVREDNTSRRHAARNAKERPAA